RCKVCGSSTHTTTDHYDIEWFKRGEALQSKKAKALKSTRVESLNANRSKTPTKRHMIGVKSYLHKYVEQPRPKVVFGDDSTCIIEGYGSIKCNGIVFAKVAFVDGLKYNLISISQLCDAKYIVQFDEKRGTIFNSIKEVIMIAPRVRDVYVLDMTSSAQESCFYAKASENLNWLWHNILSQLNFKTINKLAKQNLTSSIKKCLHLLHMDLFRPVTPRSINHEKYTLIIVDEYSRYTWVYILKKKSQAPETIMSFIKRVENQNDIKVKQLRTDNGTEFKNSILVKFYDEKRISQNFSSPYTPEQNGVSERKNRTLIEAARTMLSGSVFSKQYLTKAVATACYTQNRSTIVKIHLKTPYEIFRKRIPNINFLHVFGCPVYIYNHKDHLEKSDEKADDGYHFGYSLISKAFRVFNTRRQQTEENYHVTFDESPDAIKISKPSADNINIAENERYPPDEYLHPYEPSQIPNGQTDQNDQTAQTDEILNDNLSKHSNHNNDEKIIDNLPNTKDIQISKHSSSPNIEDTLVQDIISIPNPPLPIPLVVTPAPQDRWSQEKHIELVNIIGNPEAGMLTRSMSKQLSVTSTHECLFVDFLVEKEPKKVSKALKHPGWIKQSERGISINQEKYVKDLLKKYDINGSSVKTPMVPSNNLGPDLSAKAVNDTRYRGFDLKGYLDSDYTSFNMDGKSTSGTMAAVDIDTLTMEQYLALSRENQAPGVVKPEFGGNVTFKIKSQFMHELREDTFFGNKNKDAHDHIDRVLNIVGFFNIPGVSKDAVML
ncbi:retrovirus-related pol polyprotein from transposon TNT 1-94, partial [Tanacetum coccineum]